MKTVRIRNFASCFICANHSDPHDVGAEIQLVLTLHVCHHDIDKINWPAVYELPGEMNLLEFVKMLSSPEVNLDIIKRTIIKAIAYEEAPELVKIGGGNNDQGQPNESLDE